MANVAALPNPSPPLAFISKRILARVLLAELDDPTSTVLRECFKQFGILTISSHGDTEKRLQKEKFEAIVVQLGREDAESILNAARNSASNSRVVVYGIARNTPEAMRHSKLGINAIVDYPVDRQAALKIVRSTHLLVVHELRRYVRVPMVTEVKLDYGRGSLVATSVEISAGGMSMKCDVRPAKDDSVELSMSLPPQGKLVLTRATVCWRRDEAGMIGVRFDPGDERRLEVKRWIDSYLEIG